MRETEAWLRELWLLRGAHQRLAGLKRELQCRIGLAARTAAPTAADVPRARKNNTYSVRDGRNGNTCRLTR
ncbi:MULTISPECIES: hypothetical protein [unclassified Streptomyces]|uniref:hypothetical protein n=1 Tax=unclassified Streptomyces TaxID=2593676 RepID=UPI00224EB548|nr:MULTISPECIES: hypothetical protein [unclassified Streptomyces]MCX5328203.1 hypothetical protein [Streptomyces sp. NBC_00140]MCX5357611.1 hypothetical protein [Streptomyces sp. NBC_00124]